jgi:hypothetical protein
MESDSYENLSFAYKVLVDNKIENIIRNRNRKFEGCSFMEIKIKCCFEVVNVSTIRESSDTIYFFES